MENLKAAMETQYSELLASWDDLRKRHAQVVRDLREAKDIIDMLVTVTETGLIQDGEDLYATPSSALGRARAFLGRPQ
jgi:hypothetical protein